MNRKTLIIGLLAIGGFSCATPRELVEARKEYLRISSGPTAQLNPAGLAEAKQALNRAESEHKREFDSNVYYFAGAADSPDLAYIAMRKAQIAEAEANAKLAENERARLNKELEQRAMAKRKAEQEREAESRRLAAEKEAADAAAKLSTIAAVKQEERGTVLTLAGSVVFGSGKATLRPDSLDKLKKVAAALRDISGKTFIVEGHTDSIGSDQANLRLSNNRAETVRNFLIRQGLKENQIKAVGLGKTRPLGENDTPDGRAANRRVEIIVQPSKG